MNAHNVCFHGQDDSYECKKHVFMGEAFLTNSHNICFHGQV